MQQQFPNIRISLLPYSTPSCYPFPPSNFCYPSHPSNFVTMSLTTSRYPFPLHPFLLLCPSFLFLLPCPLFTFLLLCLFSLHNLSCPPILIRVICRHGIISSKHSKVLFENVNKDFLSCLMAQKMASCEHMFVHIYISGISDPREYQIFLEYNSLFQQRVC